MFYCFFEFADEIWWFLLDEDYLYRVSKRGFLEDDIIVQILRVNWEFRDKDEYIWKIGNLRRIYELKLREICKLLWKVIRWNFWVILHLDLYLRFAKIFAKISNHCVFLYQDFDL